MVRDIRATFVDLTAIEERRDEFAILSGGFTTASYKDRSSSFDM